MSMMDTIEEEYEEKIEALKQQRDDLLEAAKNTAAFLKGSHIEKDRQVAQMLNAAIAKCEA